MGHKKYIDDIYDRNFKSDLEDKNGSIDKDKLKIILNEYYFLTELMPFKLYKFKDEFVDKFRMDIIETANAEFIKLTKAFFSGEPIKEDPFCHKCKKIVAETKWRDAPSGFFCKNCFKH